MSGIGQKAPLKVASKIALFLILNMQSEPWRSGYVDCCSWYFEGCFLLVIAIT